MKILSASQIRKWDEYTIEHEPVTSLDLMERASSRCTEWIEKRKLNSKAFKIFCGKGNNGGDGLAIARQLAEKNYIVDVYIVESTAKGSNDFQANQERLHSCPVQIHYLQHSDFFPELRKEDIIIEAIYGSGLNRPLEGLAAELVKHINKSEATIISIDIPAGMFCDQPTVEETAAKATYTLTFQSVKLGFMFPENEQFFNDIYVLDIGLDPSYLLTVTSDFHLVDQSFIRHIYKKRKAFSHKGTYGHSLIIAGAKGKMGAAILCTTACLKSGVGLATSLVPAEQFVIIQTAVPEAMAISYEEMDELEWFRYASIGIGPGIGSGEEGARLLQKVLSAFNKPIVVDADGLNILSANKELLKELPPGSILSPHPKEFERLFGKTANHSEKIQTARHFAREQFVYIIIKGHNSVLACPNGEIYFNSTGNAGMATGGSGDVLTGILTGLLAQGYSSKECCLLAMFLHGRAADLAVESLSQEALIAGDIVNYLGKAFLSVNH